MATTSIAFQNVDTLRTEAAALTASAISTALGYVPVNPAHAVLTSSSIDQPSATSPTDLGMSTDRIATTHWVQQLVSGLGGGTSGLTSFNGRTGPAVVLSSTDVVTALGFTPASTSGVAGLTSFNSRTGPAITLVYADVTNALTYVPVNPASAILTGSPTAPTALPGTNTTQIATTEFVHSAVSGGTGVSGVSTFNSRSGAVTLGSDDVVTALQNGANLGTINIATTAISSGLGSSFHLSRAASYSGGSPGYVNAAIYVDTTISAGATSFEWGVVSVIHNYASGGENCGAYFQGNKMTRVGCPTWGACIEACDMSYLDTSGAIGNPMGLVGLEVDNWCNGPDTSNTRIGLDVVVGDAHGIRTGTAGAKGIAWAGVRVAAQGGNNNVGAFQNALAIGSADSAGVWNYATGTWGIRHTGSYIVGIDLSTASHSSVGGGYGSAIRIKANDYITFDAFDQFRMKLNSTNSCIEFYNNATRHGYINLSSGSDVDLAAGGSGTSLGFTPVTQTGSSTISIGWSGSALTLQVGSSSYGSVWPITTAFANRATTQLGSDNSTFIATTEWVKAQGYITGGGGGGGGSTGAVLLGSSVQNTSTNRVQLSNTGNYSGSQAAWIADAKMTVFRSDVSPSTGYLFAAVLGESVCNFNGVGAEVVGGYFVARGNGTIGGSVHDVVGVSGTAMKDTNCWAAGGHFDVYDAVAGGTAIGVNIEMRNPKSGTTTIGVNIQPDAGTAISSAIHIGDASSVDILLDVGTATMSKLLNMNSASGVWLPGTAGIGTFAGGLKIMIDGNMYHIPVYA